MLGAENESTIPIQLHMSMPFALSSPMTSLKAEKINPQTQTTGASTLSTADSKLFIIVSIPANAGLAASNIGDSPNILKNFVIGQPC